MPPPPPPPPPGPPPPPVFNNSASKAPASSGDSQGRNMLLESIRQGKALKKTVVNDRSVPIVDSKVKSPVASGGNNASCGPRSNGLNIPPGLGDLFAGGMPKLKPVGSSPGKVGSRNTGNTNGIPRNNSNSSIGTGNTMGAPSPSQGSQIQSHRETPAKPPPPQPPPASAKPTTSHTQVVSVTNSSVREEKKPVPNFGKPSLAPKPPVLNGGNKPARPNPPPKLPNLYIPPPPPPMASSNTSDSSDSPQAWNTNATPPPGVNRAQSMRMPKSTSPTTATPPSIEYRTMGRAAGRALGSSNVSGQPPPPPRVFMNGAPRPRQNPLRPPSARPPPPPTSKVAPAQAPPPPPGAAPPPPPHRTSPAPMPPQLRVNGTLGPLPPVPLNGPPPPPTRNSSMRSTASANSLGSSSGSSSSSTYTGVDLEAKFKHLFTSLADLPGPEPYTGMVKTYPSKNAQSVKRQPAPQPPTQVQLGNKMWVNNTSTC